MVKLSVLKGIRGQYRLRVRYRLMVLEYATVHGPTGAARRYGVCVRTVRRWRGRWRGRGPRRVWCPAIRGGGRPGLRPEVIEHIRPCPGGAPLRGGAHSALVAADHQVAAGHGNHPAGLSGPRLALSAADTETRARQLKLSKRPTRGAVQVDVKFVKIAGQWAFQYTALDDCTRFRVLRLYRRLYHGASLAFLTRAPARLSVSDSAPAV